MIDPPFLALLNLPSVKIIRVNLNDMSAAGRGAKPPLL